MLTNEQRREVNRLLEERAGHLEHARTLMAPAEAENRSLLASEQRQFDQALAKAEELGKRADRLERFYGSMDDGATRQIRPEGIGGVGGESGEARESFALGREQRMADWVARRPSRSQFDTRDAQMFSLGRAVRGMLTGRWDDADLERRALGEGTDAAGGFLVPAPLAATVIDRIRPRARVLEAGATVVPMESETLSLPRLAAGVQGAWRAENTAVTEDDPAFERVLLEAKTLAVLTRLSFELFEDMSPAGADIITRELEQSLGLELDRVALRGSGTAPEPRGVRNTSGVPIIANGTNGAALTWDLIVTAVSTVREANVDPNAVLYSPRAEKSLAGLKDSTGQYLQPPAFFEGITFMSTGQIPVDLTTGTSEDTSEVYAGYWPDLLIGVRPSIGVRILTSNERYMDTMQVGVLAWLRADVAVAHPASFAVSTGIRP